MLEPSEISRWERQLRAMLKAGADQDPEGLATVVELVTQAYRALPLMVELNRAQHDYSWADLATALPMTRQAAHERFSMSHAAVDGCRAAAGLPADQLPTQVLTGLLQLAIGSVES